MRPALRYYYYHSGESDPAPFRSDALFSLNGTIEQDGADYYFKDVSGNGRRFLITGYDFPSNWSGGFPFKSFATISAPADDATLIAADIHNFLYDTNGDPVQLTVMSLFQDIDYEHKIFCRHRAQVLNDDDVETVVPCVDRVVLYNTVKAGADLTTCQTYFSVPTEQGTAVWISPTGDDTTGLGTKASPWRSLNKIRNNASAYLYLKTGNYDMASAVTFTGNATNLVGLGNVSFRLADAVTTGCIIQRPMTVTNCVISDTSTTQGLVFNIAAHSTFRKCKLMKISGVTFVVVSPVTINVEVDTCILTGDFIGRLFSLKNTRSNKTVSLTAQQGMTVFNNEVVCTTEDSIPFRIRSQNGTANITGIVINSNRFVGTSDVNYIAYVGGPSEADANAMHGMQFVNNHVENNIPSSTNGSCHTLFIGGGIDHVVRWNRVISQNGYGLVVKAGGGTYTIAGPHISYNVFKFTGACLNGILNRGTNGLEAGNNTLVNYQNVNAFRVDDNGSGQSNSFEVYQNIVSLGGNTTSLAAGTNMTTSNNVVNRNGFTLTTPLSGTDVETSISVDTDGIPASRVNGGSTIADHETGLAVGTSIPDNPTYADQDGTWQVGAYILN